jgi:small subunit ribosomal protein S8e
MVQWHWDLHKRKKTGGKKRIWRKKRKYEMGGVPTETELGETRLKVERVKGGLFKIRLLRAEWANVYDPEAKKVSKTKILKVIENPANREYSRRGVISKGAIIETEMGRAIVVSRPGQDGVVNARLLKS